MEVYLSRNHQTCLHLFPLSVGRFQDVFNQPNGPDGQPPHFVISRFVSPVKALDRNLKDVVIWDLSGLSQLNELVEAVERMSGRDLQIFSGALDLEPISSPADALHVSQQMERYERIDGAATEEKLGRWLVEREQSDIRFPEEVRPYLDYAAIGSRYHDCPGGVFTPEGYVRRRETVPALEKDTVICLTLATTEQSDTLLLPASEEQMEETKEALEIDDFSQAVIAGVNYYDKASRLDHLIPTDRITVEDANALALCLQEMKEEDGGLMKFCAVLEVEQPGTFAEALNIAMDRDDYELVPEDLAKYAEQNLRLAGAGDEILNMLEGYTDFDGLGKAIAKEDGVRQTEFGLVRRLSEPFPAEKQEQSPQLGGL